MIQEFLKKKTFIALIKTKIKISYISNILILQVYKVKPLLSGLSYYKEENKANAIFIICDERPENNHCNLFGNVKI